MGSGIVGYPIEPCDFELSGQFTFARMPQYICTPMHIALDADDDVTVASLMVGNRLQVGIHLPAPWFRWQCRLPNHPWDKGLAVDAAGVAECVPAWRKMPRLVIEGVRPGEQLALTVVGKPGAKLRAGMIIASMSVALLACGEPTASPDAGVLQPCEVACGDTEYTCDVDGCRCSSPLTPPTPCTGACRVQLGGTP